jgi:hypothetical protein
MGNDNRDFMQLFRKGGWAVLGLLLVIVVAILIS